MCDAVTPRTPGVRESEGCLVRIDRGCMLLTAAGRELLTTQRRKPPR